jgi:hypothetical protein
LPAASLARTLKLCGATLRPLYALGLEQLDQAEPSSMHSYLATPTLSLPLNEKDAEVDVVEEPEAGPAVMLVSGAAVSVVPPVVVLPPLLPWALVEPAEALPASARPATIEISATSVVIALLGPGPTSVTISPFGS